MKKLFSKFRFWVEETRDFLEERGSGAAQRTDRSRFRRFAHFWLMVWKSFTRNRCPVRASALAYTTLLAMIPMLAVAISVSTSILKKEGEQRISKLIDKFVASVTPQVVVNTNGEASVSTEVAPHRSDVGETNSVAADPGVPDSKGVLDTRKQVIKTINSFVQNTSSGTLGVTGMVLLVFAAISMLSRIEGTFNDIWGVTQGRGWFARIWQYWGVITLGPILAALALGLASGPHFEATKAAFASMPVVGSVLFHFLPVVVLCVSFGLFYMLMPNTKVHLDAAMVGGVVAGLLWHINNLVSVLYVSRVVTNSKIYGSLAMVPVFMVGLYFSWLILLFGAQVAYAWQNRAAYLQEKQTELINQRGREFVALRLMTSVGLRFRRGERPATVPEMAAQLAVPSRLVHQIMQALLMAQLVVEVTGKDIAYAPARPLETVTCHDILQALRGGQAQLPRTGDEPARQEVYGEFARILEAEQKAASAVTLLTMVNRTEELSDAKLKIKGGERKKLPPGEAAEKS